MKPESNASVTAAIPSLDGLRGLSIILVMLAHAQYTRWFPAAIPTVFLDRGFLGVQVFFVVSGFLITTLLLRERQATGHISLRLFYARRTLRIFPALYLFVGVVAILSATGVLELPPGNLWLAATYTMNFGPDDVWATGHLWTLSVEEQFYLVWPLVLAYVGMSRALIGAAVVAFMAPPILLAMFLHSQAMYERWYIAFPLVADSIACGCLLGGLLSRLRTRASYRRLVASGYGDLVVIVIVGLDLFRRRPRIMLPGGETLINLALCYAVARYTDFPSTHGARLLAWKPLAWLGRHSYSLYLWQQPFLSPASHTLLQAFPINVAAAFTCAMASYTLVEAPLNRLRSRFRPQPRLQPALSEPIG